MRPIDTDVARSVVYVNVCLSVCLWIGHTDAMCKNNWTDQDAVVWGWFMGAKESCSRWGPDPPREKGNFGGCPAHWKVLGISAAVYAAKGISQSSITAWQRDWCNRLQCSRPINVTLYCPSEKSATFCNAAFRQNSLTISYFYRTFVRSSISYFDNFWNAYNWRNLLQNDKKLSTSSSGCVCILHYFVQTKYDICQSAP